ncbi:MAG: hypothetical protein K2H84_09870, partial [Paramuribaculum sp.]|nr:hypothetical protein [Paramuribaculum sp.]
PQYEIARKIGLPQTILEELAARLEKSLTDIVAPGYSGPVGIDMMLAETPDGLEIIPCIEMNLRYTMGFIASAMAERGAESGWLRI